MDPPPSHTPRPRLNPFVFPSDTDLRFVLLIVAVLGASLFAFDYTFQTIFPDQAIAASMNCFKLAEAAPPATDLPPALAPMAVRAGQLATYETCIEPLEQDQAAWQLVGLLVLLSAAGGIYWLTPATKTRRERLVPLTSTDAPDVVAELAALCDEAGLRHPPVFLWNPLNPVATGSAFGRWRRHAIALTGGLVTQFYTDPPAFRAVVRHELAHLRNADVDKTYFTVAVWQAFVVVALAPLLLILTYDLISRGTGPEFVLLIGWRAAALAALVYVTRNAVLRSRELYADVRASVWDGQAGALRRVLIQLPHTPVPSWRRPLRTHPDPATRHAVVGDPARLFAFRFSDAVLAGIVGTIAFEGVSYHVAAFLPTRAEVLAGVVAGAILGSLVAGVLGIAIWRTVFGTQMRGGVPVGIGRMGLGIGIGLVIGRSAGFYQSLGGSLGLNLLPGIAGVLVTYLAQAVMGVVLIASMVFFAQWIADGASAWLERATDPAALRRAAWTGLVLVALSLSAWLGLLEMLMAFEGFGPLALTLLLFSLTVTGTLFAFAPRDLAILGQFVTLLMCISLWAFPLAGARRGRRVAEDVSPMLAWAYLEGEGPGPARLADISAMPAVRVALVGIAAYAVLWLIVRGIGFVLLPSDQPLSDSAKTVLFSIQLGLLFLMLLAVSVWVALRSGRLALELALFALFVAGLGATVVRVVLGSWGTIDGPFVWVLFVEAVNGGLVLLPVVWLTSLLAARWRGGR